jgi:hypothetical protein
MTVLTAEDRWAIADVLAMHGHLFDGGHLKRLGEIFSPGIVYDMSGLGMGAFEGIETIRRAAEQLGDRSPVAHHVTNIVIVEADGDKATVASKGQVIRGDGTVGCVNHLDTLIRCDGQWRISRRIITPQRAPAAASLAPADG